MKTMNLEQMEVINGGSAAGCAAGVVGGFVAFSVAMIASAPTPAVLPVAIGVGSWYFSILTSCLL
jgi:hypothetical protein